MFEATMSDQLISNFVFAALMVQFLYFVNVKSSHLLWQYSPFVLGLVRNPVTQLKCLRNCNSESALINITNGQKY